MTYIFRYPSTRPRLLGKNPYLRRDQMMKVIARSLAIYQRKHAGEFPKRVVVQKNTEFKSEEVDGCFDALLHTFHVELVHVQQGCGWRGIQIAAPHQPHGYPCRRGTTFQVGPYDTLLWTQGNLPEITPTGRADYYKEGKGIPEPLLLIRHAGVGSTDDLCREVLALTKMDWNNDGPYDRLPVTLSFARMLAKIVKRMPKLEPRSYAFGCLCNCAISQFARIVANLDRRGRIPIPARQNPADVALLVSASPRAERPVPIRLPSSAPKMRQGGAKARRRARVSPAFKKKAGWKACALRRWSQDRPAPRHRKIAAIACARRRRSRPGRV